MKLKADDLEKIYCVEDCSKINIDAIIRNINKIIKKKLLIEALNYYEDIKIISTKTRFGGEKYWFTCPNCNRRCSNLYIHPLLKNLSCLKCLNLLYENQKKFN